VLLVDGTPFGRYRLVSLLGRGGMGEVWRAYDTVTDRVVALKVLPAQLAKDSDYQARFRREARAAAGLNNPHIVPIHDYGEIDDRLFVTMALVDGQDLAAKIARGPLLPAQAVNIIDQIAGALHAAHRNQLIHRDVKPSNILLDEDDYAYLIDFGIARAATDTKLTHTGMTLGTWAYMAPERFTSGQTDPSVDIYALACVLHETLTGTTPYPGDSVEQVAAGHMFAPPPRPSVIQPGLPPQLDDVIATGMAKNPSDRYPTTRDLARAAQSALDGTTPGYLVTHPSPVQGAPTQLRVPADSPVDPSAPSSRPASAGRSRKRLVVYSTIGVVLTVLAVVAAFVVPNLSDEGASGAAPPSSVAPTALPNSGPLTGTFTAALGQESAANSPQFNGLAASTQTWQLRSDCANGCIAIASTGVEYPAPEIVFDKVGDRWAAVFNSPGQCNDTPVEWWDVISLRAQPDGTVSGDWTRTTAGGCRIQRTLALKRTGDTDVAELPDPTDVPRRVVSQGQALHGTYRYDLSYVGYDVKRTYDLGVRTECLRNGIRCMSFFADAANKANLPFIFLDGQWTSTLERDLPCNIGGTSHVKETASFPLPQPPQDPIAVVGGQGHNVSTGSSCPGSETEFTFTRIGD
jgi:serine/threonine protein kinase